MQSSLPLSSQTHESDGLWLPCWRDIGVNMQRTDHSCLRAPAYITNTERHRKLNQISISQSLRNSGLGIGDCCAYQLDLVGISSCPRSWSSAEFTLVNALSCPASSLHEEEQCCLTKLGHGFDRSNVAVPWTKIARHTKPPTQNWIALTPYAMALSCQLFTPIYLQY